MYIHPAHIFLRGLLTKPPSNYSHPTVLYGPCWILTNAGVPTHAGLTLHAHILPIPPQAAPPPVAQGSPRHSAHLAEELAPVQAPQHEGDDEQQQEDDGHQAANEDGGRAPLGLGHRLLAPGLQLWWRQKGQDHGWLPTQAEGAQGGLVTQDPHALAGAPGQLTQAAEVGGRWAGWPPGGWCEGAPQSQGGVIHNIWGEGRKKGRSDREEATKGRHTCMRPREFYYWVGSKSRADTQCMYQPTRIGGGTGSWRVLDGCGGAGC